MSTYTFDMNESSVYISLVNGKTYNFERYNCDNPSSTYITIHPYDPMCTLLDGMNLISNKLDFSDIESARISGVPVQFEY